MTIFPREGRWIGGCRCEPRYDVEPPEYIPAMKGSAQAMSAWIEAASTKSYVRDVCIRCGKTIERSER